MKFLGVLAAALGAATMFAAPIQAQPFPSKPVTIVAIAAPGGAYGVFTRLIADNLEKKWKQSVLVDSRPGAGGLIAADFVKRAAPDGYTLLMGSDALSTYRLLMKGADFDAEKDITPITILTSGYYLIQTNGKVPAKNMEEFIAYAKANPGKLNFGATGQSQQLLDTYHFLNLAGLDMAFIPYPGAAPAVQAMLSNDLHLYFGAYNTSAGHLKEGTLTALATSGPERIEQMPDVPTLKETGIDQIAGYWFGLMGPAGLPAPITARIAADVQETLKDPEIVAQIKKLNYSIVASTPGEMKDAIVREGKIRADAARRANIQPQ